MASAAQARSQPKRFRVLACEACRSRRTRCDGRKPTCGTCESRGCDCHYPEYEAKPLGGILGNPCQIICANCEAVRKTNEPLQGADSISSVEEELSQIRSQLDRIENVVTTPGPPQQWRNSSSSQQQQQHGHNVMQIRGLISSPGTAVGSASTVSASPGQSGAVVDAQNYPYMKCQTSTFTELAGLGPDYGKMLVRLEQEAPVVPSKTSPMFVLQHSNVVSAMQSFSARIHPWYPILEDRFSDCINSFVAKPFQPGTDTFLVLIVLASGTMAQDSSHNRALQERPDAMYLNAAMEMLHLVMLEQSLRSVQCLVAASIHYYLLLRPTQAHDLVVFAIKKAQNLKLSGTLRDDQLAYEHWIRVYRIALLIEGELVVPLELADSHAWESEDEIRLPTGTNIWTLEGEEAGVPVDTPGSTRSARSDDVITYLLAEIAMRRMLRRNTTAITLAEHAGEYKYAPLVAKELEAQLEQWCQYLPEQLRFSREFSDLQHDVSLQTPFLRVQYWAGMVSFYWPSIVQVMDTQQLSDTKVDDCKTYFHSYREFIKSATGTLDVCLPNKWTLYASIFAITLGAYMGATNARLAHIASRETWDVIFLARDSFGEECQHSPSLALMAESMRKTLSAGQDN